MSNPMVIQPDDSCDHLLEEPRVLSPKSDHLDALDQLDASRTTFHCGQCRTIFGSRTAVRAQRKMNTCRKKQEAPCSSEHEHEPLRLQLDSMDAALNCRLQNQLDRYFSFKGTKSTGGVPGSYRMLRCNQNVSIYGCVAHSHPLAGKNIRLSTSIKDRTAALLTSGITPEVVIDKYLSTNDMDPDSKPVTYHDIYRIKKSLNLNGYDWKASEVRNVSSLLVDPSFHGFNYGKKFDMFSMSKDIADKVIETSGYFLLTYASPDMIQRFHDHPTTISIDGTHGTNAAKYVLISILMFGNYCIPSILNNFDFEPVSKIAKNVAQNDIFNSDKSDDDDNDSPVKKPTKFLASAPSKILDSDGDSDDMFQPFGKKPAQVKKPMPQSKPKLLINLAKSDEDDESPIKKTKKKPSPAKKPKAAPKASKSPAKAKKTFDSSEESEGFSEADTTDVFDESVMDSPPSVKKDRGGVRRAAAKKPKLTFSSDEGDSDF
ncbi:hypothetical protein TCAL_15601 [Tigriopus californicus]|uniref:Uncharacterized protein n=1 Tax=Tigriopus californicus TaxID=6832 RepID=A0A553PCE5_TIGCA|nr:hypothetical protein TCAL_15601 [Tigriopus californicus]